jgi:peroxiredoxin
MAARTRPIEKGETAPDFTLKDQHEEDFTLSAHKGKKVLLSFHPLAWTGVCAQEIKDIEAKQSVFASFNTISVAISVDSIATKNAWAKDMGVKKTRLLSDFWPHGRVCKLYGLFREEDGKAQRANVIVDEKGKVAWVKVYVIDHLPELDEVVDVLKKL